MSKATEFPARVARNEAKLVKTKTHEQSEASVKTPRAEIQEKMEETFEGETLE